MKLKVCGMRKPENIDALMERVNPDFVGFIFYPKSPRYFLNGMGIIPESVPSEKRTGVFVNATKMEILKTAGKLQLRNIQLHGDESPEFCEEIMDEGFLVIKALGIKNAADLAKSGNYLNSCDFLLFDTKSETYGGTGTKFNWQVLENYSSKLPFFLSGGIDLMDVQSITNTKVKPHAIDINSRFEDAPGEKNISNILAFKKELSKYE